LSERSFFSNGPKLSKSRGCHLKDYKGPKNQVDCLSINFTEDEKESLKMSIHSFREVLEKQECRD
jgi:hypothetical protein